MAPTLRDEIGALKVELARLAEKLDGEIHDRRNLKTAVTNLDDLSRSSTLALQDVRHQVDTLRTRVAAIESRLRGVARSRAALLTAIVGAIGAVAAAAVGWLR